MRFDSPPPGEPLNMTGEDVPVRQAASVIVLRGGEEALEVLLVQRTPKARFMGGVWVFPGGAVDAHEGEGDTSHRLAAVRELEEEAAITGIEPGELVKFSQWITPRQVAIRFDTHFFLAPLPDGPGAVDRRRRDRRPRLVHAPGGARRAHERGSGARLPDDQAPRAAGAVRDRGRAARVRAPGAIVQPVEPRVVREGEVARVLLPGEPGYDEDRPEWTPS